MFYIPVTARLKSEKFSSTLKKRRDSMRKAILITILVLSLAMVAGLIIAANATYNVTSNVADPSNVAPGTNVIITAQTNENFLSATFTWKNPAGNIILEETVPFTGTPKTAVSDMVVNDGGVWEVAVYSNNGQKIGVFEYTVRLGFNVIPELPLIGTAGASIAMIAGLAYKMKRKPPQ